MTTVPECRQLKRDGLRCKSPALRGRSHCFYHGYTRPAPSTRPRSVPFFLQPVFSAESLQCALGQLLHAVAGGQLTDRRARLLLRGLETFARSLDRASDDPTA